MQQSNVVNTSNIDNPPGTFVVGKRKSYKKTIILFIVVMFFVLVALVSVLLVLSNTNSDPEVTPTILPTPTAILPTSTPEVTPTELVSPTPQSSSKQKYILTGCEIEITVDPKWVSAPRGELSTCGIFSTEGTGHFTNLTDYPGTLIAVLPYTAESIFTPEKAKTYQEYLKSLPNQSNRYDPTKDFLYSQTDTKVAGFSAIEAEIYKARLGETKQIFYQGFSRQYVIVWGGQTAVEFEDEVDEIIGSIRQLVVIPEEE